MQKGRLVILSGPSGVGKNTLLKQLIAKHPNLHSVVSYTTRQPRPHEVEGVDYLFVDRPKFNQLASSGQLIEKVEYASDWYGIAKDQIEPGLANGQTLVAVVEVDGAEVLRRLFPDQTLRIFIMPPDLNALKERLSKRATDEGAEIKERLMRVGYEIEQGKQFEHTVVNPDGKPDLAVAEIEKILGY